MAKAKKFKVLPYTDPVPKYKFLQITWDDAVSTSDWISHDDLPDLLRIVSRGWAVKDTPKGITLASTINGDQFGEVTTIPKGMIVGITELEVRGVGSSS